MNRFALAVLLCTPVSSIMSAQDKPLPPLEAAKKMTLPKGFHARLFAGEPDVVQPIAFTFDDRGRLWVVECLSYPHWRADGNGHDRVTVFEDTDGDGHFDIRQVVYDKGSNLSGIELGHGGIWLCSVPNLLFIPCDFNADRPALRGKPEIKLEGWNYKDTKHNIFNSLIWGPDGWLYGCNGIQSKSFVAKPGTPMKDRKEFNCGVWRYHPIRQVFEPVCQGTTNPFGLDYDEYGEMFITNCVIHHLFHVIPGAHYDRMYGQDLNPYTYGLMHSIADYIHWAGGDWTTSRGNKPEHSDAGGGHAHVGCMVYLGDNWPDEYRGSLFTCNLHGNRINRDLLKRQGSGYKAERGKDFMFANDPWFRGLAIKYGPDGGVFVTDWCDTGECHNYEKIDLTNGRIHKIVYGKVKPWKGDLSKLSDEELAKLHAHKNEWFARHARRLLLERAESNPAQKGRISVDLRRVQRHVGQSVTAIVQCALTAAALGEFQEIVDLTEGNLGRNRQLQGLAVRLFIDHANRGLQPRLRADDVRLCCPNPDERLALASEIQRIPVQDRYPWAVRLMLVTDSKDDSDANIPLMSWYAIEPLIGEDRGQTKKLLRLAKLPIVREYIARKATSKDHAYMGMMLQWAVESNDPFIARDLLQGTIDGLNGAREVQAPSDWLTTGPSLLKHRDRAVRERAMTLAAIFGDAKAIESMRKTAADAKADSGDRIAALHTLERRNKPDLLPILQQLVHDNALRPEAIRGLAAFKDPGTPALLLKLYPNFTDAEKQDAVATLASRADWSLALLDAIEKDTVPRRDVSVFTARQMQGSKDKRVVERLAKVWGQIQSPSKQRAALTAKYKAILSEASLAKADLSKGRAVFAKNCATCHKLYDDGGDIGPQLTGSQRSNLDYILENVLDPSAVVPNEYRVMTIDLLNGRRINGIIKAESDKSLTVRTSNETLVIPKDEIDSRTPSKMSMMPDGLLDKLTEQEVKNLVAYLRGKQQVPLPEK